MESASASTASAAPSSNRSAKEEATLATAPARSTSEPSEPSDAGYSSTLGQLAKLAKQKSRLIFGSEAGSGSKAAALTGAAAGGESQGPNGSPGGSPQQLPGGLASVAESPERVRLNRASLGAVQEAPRQGKGEGAAAASGRKAQGLDKPGLVADARSGGTLGMQPGDARVPARGHTSGQEVPPHKPQQQQQQQQLQSSPPVAVPQLPPGQGAADAASEGSPPGKGPVWTDKELVQLAHRMSEGVDVRDRQHMLKRYRSCFVGEEAVKWMLAEKIVRSEDEAVRLGNEMQRLGLLYHVTHEYPFLNRHLFYRFFLSPADEAADAGAMVRFGDQLQDNASWRRVPWGTNSGPGWSLASELTRVQRRLAGLAAEAEVQRGVGATVLGTVAAQGRTSETTLRGIEARLQQVSLRQRSIAKRLDCAAASLLLLAALLVAAQVATPLGPVLWALPVLASMLGAAGGMLGVWPGMGGDPDGRDACGLAGEHAQVDSAQLMERALSARQQHSAATTAESSVGSESEPDDDDEPSTPTPMAVVPQLAAPPAPLTPPPADSDFEGWPDAPVLVRMRALPYQRCLEPPESLDPARIPINTGRKICIETDLFKGCVAMYVAGVGSAPQCGAFSGRRRKTLLAVQGRFKTPMSFNDLLTGQDFSRPACDWPARMLLDLLVVKLTQKLSSAVFLGPTAAPYLLVPVLAMAQGVQVSRPGEEPDLATVGEDMRLVSPKLCGLNGKPWSAAERRKHFRNTKNRESFSFDTEHVWTFHIYQHLVDCSSYEMNLLGRMDIAHHLDGQPLQFMCKDRASGQYLFNFEIWHQKLLADARAAYARLSGSTTSTTGGGATAGISPAAESKAGAGSGGNTGASEAKAMTLMRSSKLLSPKPALKGTCQRMMPAPRPMAEGS